MRSILAFSSMHEFPRRQTDFVLDFTHNDLDVDALIDIPLGMWVEGNRVEWVLKLNKSLYGPKQWNLNWFDILKHGQEIRGYHQSHVYPCVFYTK